MLRSIRRVVKRQGREIQHSDVPGVFFLEIDGLAEPVLRRAITNGHCPTMARWMQDGSHRIIGWECDLSSQTSASQAGLLLGSNDGIPAFRWYERDRATRHVEQRQGRRDGRGAAVHRQGPARLWRHQPRQPDVAATPRARC